MVDKIVRIGFTVGLGALAVFFSHQAISLFFKGLKTRSPFILEKHRLKTLRDLCRNAASVVIVAIIVLMALDELDFDIVPIVTGAGILGLVISFGSQTLIKDLLAGLFIIAENQYNLGDTIRIDDLEGAVEKITFRITVLKDRQGNLIYIPNSEIKKVIVQNKSQDLEPV